MKSLAHPRYDGYEASSNIAGNYPQGQRQNGSLQQSRQTRSHRSDVSNGISIVLIGLFVFAIVLIIALVVIWNKESGHNFTQKSESTTNATQQDSKLKSESKTDAAY